MFSYTIHSLLCLALAVLSPVQAQSPRPAAAPVAARSPYLLNFQTSLNGARAWQTGYNNVPQSWAGLIRVDGETYAWSGDLDGYGFVEPVEGGDPVQSVTPTTSVFTYHAGPVAVTVTFLNPIEPGNLVKQSIPASYVALDVEATDGSSHSIQVYTDISAEWASGSPSQNVTWSTTASNPSILYHSISTANQTPYHEVAAHSVWGSIHYAALITSQTTYRTGYYYSVRQQFSQNGTLDNSQDTAFRAINDSWPVFGFAQDLGNIERTATRLVWAVANIRDSGSNGALTYTDLSGKAQMRSLYYRSQYADDGTLLSDFLGDFSSAFNRSQIIDKMITQSASTVGSQNYVDILSLVTLQAYCGIEITIGRDASGNVNASDVMAFYKDTGFMDSGNGNAQVSPVDGLLSVFPTFLYLDPVLCGLLLEPLLRFQDDTSYGNAYAALNMGSQYPTAVGSSEEHSRGVETSSGMIIMAFGHAKATNNYSIITRYYILLKKWADYLTLHTLDSNATSTTADGTTVNGADLAFQGIIAVRAMSNISALVNDSVSRDSYASHAEVLYSQWLTTSFTTSGHLRSSVNDTDSSFSLGYNMFWDLALGTALLNTTIVDAQTKYLANVIQTYGASTSSKNPTLVSADRNMMAAAVATRDQSTQQAFINAIHKIAYVQPADGTFGQFPLIFTADDGTVITGRSSPRQGAAYASLLVNASSFLSSTGNVYPSDAQPVSEDKSKAPVGTIIGATLGAVAAASLLAGLVFLVRRRRRTRSKQEDGLRDVSSAAHFQSDVTPFMEIDPSGHSPSSAADDLSLSGYAARWPEMGTKEVYRLRRVVGEELQQEANAASTTALGPPVSDQSTDPDILREINNLWREIVSLRRDDAMSAPPEYNA